MICGNASKVDNLKLTFKTKYYEIVMWWLADQAMEHKKTIGLKL